MSRMSWAATTRLVHRRAHGCCEYCQTCENIVGQAMHIEHIDPFGSDSPDNLCLSCASCNLSKARATSAIDPQTGQHTALFNPRQQTWSEHFAWVQSGLRLVGLTATGRTTIERLKINQAHVVNARAFWIEAGRHPPVLP